jgi:hypothetical protein
MPLTAVEGPWGCDPITGERPADNRVALRAMCDYGAGQVAAGVCDGLAFACMPYERPYISEYMAASHPTVRYGWR